MADVMARALEAAARGWAVFPVRVTRAANGKKDLHPIASWREASSADPATVAGWWVAGSGWSDVTAYGIDCAKAGIVGIDPDGPEGVAEWESFGVEPAALVVRTPGGGQHHYYAERRDRAIGNTAQGAAGGIGEHIDTRGPGGFLFGPGSSWEGGAWEIERGSIDVTLTPCPDTVYDRSRASRGREVTRTAAVAPAASGGDPFGPPALPPRTFTQKEAVEFCRPFLAALATARNGSINGSLNTAAKVLAHFGPEFWSRPVAEDQLYSALRETVWDDATWKAADTIESAYSSASRDWRGTLVEEPPAPAANVGEDVGDTGWRLVDGETFLFGTDDTEEMIWGRGDCSLWSPGESLMLVGPPGVGKSTLAHCLVMARLGIMADALGYPVVDDGGRVLYLAMDRPRQIKRAMRRLARQITPEQREVLRDRLIVQYGPMPLLLGEVANRGALAALAAQHGVSTIIVDSIKDAVSGESDEQQAGAYNMARQACLAANVQWAELHHNRKGGADNKAPRTLDDVYGSRKLTSGAGSVLSLWGQAGDVVVELTQIKSPMEQHVPMQVLMDLATGLMAPYKFVDLPTLVQQSGHNGVTPNLAAEKIFGKKPEKLTKSDIESTRGKLKRMVANGFAEDYQHPIDGTTYYRVRGSGITF